MMTFLDLQFYLGSMESVRYIRSYKSTIWSPYFHCFYGSSVLFIWRRKRSGCVLSAIYRLSISALFLPPSWRQVLLAQWLEGSSLGKCENDAKWFRCRWPWQSRTNIWGQYCGYQAEVGAGTFGWRSEYFPLSLSCYVSSHKSKKAFHPFYIFQIASLVLWSLDEYYYYAVCIFLISVFSIGTTVIETKSVWNRKPVNIDYYLLTIHADNEPA